MIPNINPKQMERMMKQMGVKQEKIDSYEVVIKTKDKNLIVKNPNVLKINMAGQESLQITGDIEEEAVISEEDINTVAEQAGVDKETAKHTLEKNNGDLAAAIMELQNK